jgi:cytochrome P450
LIADRLVADVRDFGRMDLIESYAFPLPLLVIAELLGMPAEDRGLFRTWSNAFVTPVAEAEDLDRFLTCMEGFTTYLRGLMTSRAAAPRNDLLAALMQAEDSGERLSESELFSMVILLIVAGHETTMNLLGNGVLALLDGPDRWREVGSDPFLMRAAVEELLRYDAPLDRALSRWAVEDTVICGVTIRRGERVVALIGAANRDPRQFGEPEGLSFHRPSNPHCAFGRGAHYCLGAPLARLEGQIGLSTLVAAFPDLRLSIDRSALTWRPIPHMRSLRSLPVEWTVTPAGQETGGAVSAPPR